MKNLLKKSTFLLSFLFIITGCDTVEVLNINPDANTVLSLSATSLVLTEDMATNEVLTMSWTDPNFGFDAAATYKILIDVAGGDFSAPQIVPVSTNLSKVFTGGELNNKLLSLGLAPDVAVDVDIIVQTTLSEFQTMLSNTITLNVTPYSSLLDLSTNLGLVGSATPGGWGNENIPDIPFYTTDSPDVYVAYATLRDGEIKFRKDNLWTENYGDTGADGTIEQDGDNIVVSAGTYKITVNFGDNSWSMEEYSWGLVGDATPNGWGGPDFKMNYNPYQNNWKAAVTLVDGEMKFRFNDLWALNYGDTGVDGTIDADGDNIVVTGGHYIVTLDLNTLTYELEPIDIWGLVGSGAPNGWDGPNVKFTPDFGINEGVWYINGVTLVDGEIKVRQNDAWGLNYGDDGNDGVLEVDGANIPVTAGTYNIVIDFSAADPTIALYAW